jgi:hypothetical protein
VLVAATRGGSGFTNSAGGGAHTAALGPPGDMMYINRLIFYRLM